MNAPRDHHYVPRFYLSGWCQPNGKLCVFSRQHNRVVISELHPRSTGFERDLYAYELADTPEEQQSLETGFFKRIDDLAAPVLAKMLDKGLSTIHGEERSHFTRFVLSLRARHPDAISHAHRDGRAELLKKLAERPEEYLQARDDTDADVPTLQAWVEQYAPSILPNFGLSVVPQVIVDDTLGKRVWSMSWMTRTTASADLDFITGDRPCILEGDARGDSCLIGLPLSPKVVLFISNEPASIARLRALPDSMLVKAVNRQVAMYTAKYIYSSRKRHIALASKYLLKRR